MAKDDSTYNQKELTTAINNAVAAALKPSRIGPIPEGRLRRLTAIAKALIEPARELTQPPDGGPPAVEPEELVAILAVATLFVHLHDVVKTTKVPFAGLSKEIFE